MDEKVLGRRKGRCPLTPPRKLFGKKFPWNLQKLLEIFSAKVLSVLFYPNGAVCHMGPRLACGLGHARALTRHRRVIHSPRAASLPQMISVLICFALERTVREACPYRFDVLSVENPVVFAVLFEAAGASPRPTGTAFLPVEPPPFSPSSLRRRKQSLHSVTTARV